VQESAVAGVVVLNGEEAFFGHVNTGMFARYGNMIQDDVTLIAAADCFRFHRSACRVPESK
jgi:hypothetical protein